MLRSQKIRKSGPEIDALRMGMDWNREDLDKPQIMIGNTYGYGHPGSFHLQDLVKIMVEKVDSIGGKAAPMYVSDICDGIAQGHEGMNYSLLSREFIAYMIELQALAAPYDGVALMSSCDKGLPAQLIALARLGLPGIHLSGGTMAAGPNNLSLEQVGKYSAQLKKGDITEKEFKFYQENACPSCGACQFMGTASTMQIMAEALGLSLPGSALIPVNSGGLNDLANEGAKAIMNLIEENITVHDVLTKDSFLNAIKIHAAIGGSSNALLHLPVIAREVGIEISADKFDEIHREIPFIVNVKSTGEYPAELFWYSGALPEVMMQIKDHLNLDVLTITGKTLGENLEELDNYSYWTYQNKKPKNMPDKRDVIASISSPINNEGSIAILKGNIAPEGSVIKHSAVHPDVKEFEGVAKVFSCEENALEAVINGEIKPGHVVIIKNEGPRGSGMPEMFYTSEAIASDPVLSKSTALVTDGRYSGATRGPAIGHVSPESVSGGPIGLLKNGDIISISIPDRSIDLIGHGNIKEDKKYGDNLLRERRKIKKEKKLNEKKKNNTGVLELYKKLATSGIKGGYLDLN